MALSLNSTFKVASSTVSGVTTFTATGKNANLSWTSVQSALQAGDSVVISSGSTGTEAGNITDQTGFQLAFSAANLKLTIETGSGAGLIGNISLDNISLSGNGSSLVLGAAGNISCGLLSGGTSSNPAPLSSAVLTAAAGSVAQQSSPADAIDADILAISASTGIGSSAAPFVTQTSNLSGQTTTGGIYLSNAGPVNISGGAIAGVNGLQVMTSGDLAMTNTGSISITNNADVVRAPGNLTITATGAAADLQTGGNNGSSGGAIQAGGTASLTAGRDLLIGSPTSGYGNVDGGSNVTLNAGGNLVLDAGSSATAHSASSIWASVGENITLSTSADQIESDSGAISLTTGTGGTLTDNGAINTAASGAGASITVSTGNVAVNGPVIAGIGTIIVQSGGAISAGSSGTVSAQTVAIQASAGIGSISAPLSTQTGNLSAKTATGGIYISNTGDLAIGGWVVPGVNGVQVTTSGDIQVTNAGSISISTNENIVKGPGDVSLTATGSDSDVQTGGNNDGASGNGAVQAGSSASISAGRDLLIGSLSLGYGDVEGGGGVVLNAGRNLILNDDTVVAAHGAGTVSATAGANITLSSNFDQILCDNGAITLTTGANGVLTNRGLIDSAYSGTGAPVTISAGNVVLSGPIVAQSGTVIIQSAGSVNDSGTFIDAVTLAVQASAGIGSATTPFSIGAVNFSAQTSTGGIYVSGDANLNISGGVIPGVDGVRVTTAGDIHLAVDGFITITTHLDTIHGPGDVTVTTNNGDITLGGNNGNAFSGAAGAAIYGASITLDAGRYLLIGSTSDFTYADVEASGNISLQGGTEVVVDSGSLVYSDLQGSINVMSGGDVGLEAPGGAEQAEMVTANGDIVVATGSNGSLILDSNYQNTQFEFYKSIWAGRRGGSGNISINADHLMLGQADSIVAGTGLVTIQPVTSTESIQLGTTTDNELDISNLELQKITAGILRIGAASDTGNIIVTGPCVFDASVLSLTIDGVIQDDGSSAQISGRALALRASQGISLQTAVNELAFRNTIGGNVQIANFFPVTVTALDTLNGALNNEVGNVSPGGSITLSSDEAITFDLNTTSTGTLSIMSPGTVTTGPLATIIAPTIAIQAGTGIGALNLSLKTQTANLSALTDTGGIYISNSGNLNINGGVNPNVNGIQVTTSGTLLLSNNGDITATTEGDILSAPDSVTVGTIFGNILLGGNNGLGFDSYTGSVSSSRGEVSLRAAGNLQIGDIAKWTYAAIVSDSSIVLTAGGNINVDESSFVSAHGSGTINATAGGNISVLATTSSITAAEFATQGGAINLTTGAGGTLTINSNATAIGENSIWTTRSGGNGNITISTDHLNLNAATDDVVAGTATVTIQPVTTNQAIQLGTTTDAELDLSNTELGRITAGVIRVGSATTIGNITVTAPVSTPNASTLSLQSGGSISDSASTDTITATNLAAQAGGGISLDTLVSNIAARGANIRISNSGALTITAVDALNVLIGAPINISANAIAINIPVYAGTIGAVTLTPTSGDVNLASGQSITGGSITQTAGVSTSSYAGTLTASSGGLHLTGNNFTLAGPITDTGSLVLNDTGTATLTGRLAVSGPIIMNGAGAFQLNSRLPATVSLAANAGTTTIAANTSTGIRTLNFTSLGVAAGAKLVFANSSAALGDYSNHANRTVAVVDAGGLNIATGGTLDMGDNDMILKYASANEAATKTQVFNLLQSGITPAGDWSGTGITSSEANYDSNFGIGARALGWIDNNDVQYSSFDGVSLNDFNQVMIKFTYYGDVDLSGTFDATDVNQLIAGRSHTPGNTGWEFDDLDYDGVTSSSTDQNLFFTGRNAYQKFGAL